MPADAINLPAKRDALGLPEESSSRVRLELSATRVFTAAAFTRPPSMDENEAINGATYFSVRQAHAGIVQ